MLNSLRARLTLSFVIIVLLTLVVGASSLFGLLLRYNQAEVSRQMAATTQVISRVATAKLAGRTVEPTMESRFQAQLDTAADRLGGEIYIVNPQGRVLAKGGQGGLSVGQSLPSSLVGRALAANQSREWTIREPFAERSLLLATPVREAGKSLGLLVARRPVALPRTQALSVLRDLASAGLITLVLGLVIAFALTARIVRPIRQMTTAAEAIARGEYGHKLGVKGDDEVAQLAEAFDAMSSELAGTIGRLSTEKTKLETVLSNMAEPLMALDREGRIVLANPAAASFVGRPVEALIGRPCGDCLQPAELSEAVTRGMATPVESSEEIAVRGGEVWYSLHMEPFVLADGTTGKVAVLHDITRLKAAESARRDFISNISHELRTPVTTIRGFVEAIRDGVVRGRSEEERYLGVMTEEIDRLSRLIEDLFQFSKLEAGKMDYRFEGLDPIRLVDRAADKIRPRLESAGLILDVTVENRDYPLAVADSDRIEQVFFNLIANAIRFTPTPGRVTLAATVEAGEKRVIFSVADTGAGIPAADLPHIFERFYKAKTAAGRRAGGTGLGLAIVKHIVEDHGGEVWVESEEGKGSEFSFALRVLGGEEKGV